MNFDTPKANFRARAQGFEITLLIPGREIPSSFGNILEQVESSVVETLQGAAIVGRDFTFNAHFELPPGGYQALTAPFSGEPPKGLGAPLAQGMSFYFHAPESGSESAMTMDRSIVIVDGLYFQVRSRYSPPQDLDLGPSFSKFGLLLTKVIEAANLGGAF